MSVVSTNIANMALIHINVSKPIAELDTENSQAARVCRVFYDNARQAVLRDYNWGFARKIVTLGLITTNPNTEWGYSYAYPSDCLKIIRILSPIRNDTRQSRIPWKEYTSADGNSINLYTDRENAQAEYIWDVTNQNLFQPDFVFAFSLRLAAVIAPVITGGDPFKMGDRAMQLYGEFISKCQANAANEEQDQELPDSEFVRVRSGYGPWAGGHFENDWQAYPGGFPID